MNLFQERLILSKENSGFSWTEISEATGISKSLLSHYKSGRNMPQSDNLYKLSKFLNVEAAWLAGYDIILARDNEMLINLYNKLDDIDKGRIIGTMEEMLRNDKYKDDSSG